MAIDIFNDGIPFERDIDITSNHERYQVIEISQGVHKGSYLKFNLFQNGTEFIVPTGINYKYFIDGKRADGGYILREVSSISGNSLIFKDISHYITDVVGDITLKLAWQNLNTGMINYLAEDIPVRIKKNDLYTSNATTTDEHSMMMDVLGNANTLFTQTTNTTVGTNVTDWGVAVDARQMNPDISGSLANQVKEVESRISINDDRGLPYVPQQYRHQSVTNTMVNGADISLPYGLYSLTTIKPWIDETASTIQIAIGLSDCSYQARKGTASTWSDWCSVFPQTVTAIKDIKQGNKDGYYEANFVAQASTGDNVCGYGFHIPGKLGGLLYITPTGELNYMRNSGDNYRLEMTRIN